MHLMIAVTRPLFFMAAFIAAETVVCAVPVISLQPQALVVKAGQAAVFSVTAAGTGNLTYQWRRDGIAITAATNAAFTISGASLGDSGSYDVVVSDAQQTVASALVVLRVTSRVEAELLVLDVTKTLALERSDFGFFQEILMLSDGSFFVAGTLTSVDGQPRSGLARFRGNGTLETAFTPPVFDGRVRAMALQADGKLIVGGDFRYVGGTQSGGLARLNADGSLDGSFAVGVGFAGAGSFDVRSIAVAPDGGVCVAGIFNNGYKGAGRLGSRLARLDARGAFLPEATPVHDFSDLPDSLVMAPDGKLLVTGMAFRGSGQPSPTEIRVARFLANGQEDPTFAKTAIRAFGVRVSRLKDGKLMVYGPLSKIGAIDRTGIARLNENGTLDSTFDAALPAGTSVDFFEEQTGGDMISMAIGSRPTELARLAPGGPVAARLSTLYSRHFDLVRVFPDGRWLVAASALRDSSLGFVSGLAILSNQGATITEVPGVRFAAGASSILPLPGGKILLAGEFTHVGGRELPGVARLNADYSIDPTFIFRPEGEWRITSPTVHPDGSVLIAGTFFGQSVFSGIASVLRLRADGSIERRYLGNPSYGGGSVPPVVLRDGRVMLSVGNYEPYFFVWSADGVLAPRGNFGSGPDSGGITGMARLPSGQVLVGGNFSAWNGQSRSSLVRLNGDGSVDPLLLANASSLGVVHSFDAVGAAVQSTGRALMAIRQSPYLDLRRVDSSGGVDAAFSPPSSVVNGMAGYLIQPDDKILVWSRLGSAVAGRTPVARLNANGTSDLVLNFVGRGNRLGDLNPVVTCAAVTDSGEILFAAEGELCVLRHATAPFVRSAPATATYPSGLSRDLTVSAVGSGPLTYQWLRNGQPIAGATAATYRITIITPTASGAYNVVVSDARGSITTAPALISADTSANLTMRLSNVSVRARVQELPSLTQFGVTGVMPNPRLDVFRGETRADQNDNWGGDATVLAAAAAVNAFGLATTSLDAALVSVFTGTQTAHIGGGSGVVLGEIYDPSALSSGAERIANVSARYAVGTGENILIAGFTIVGTGVKAVLIRGIGPGLAPFGVTDAIMDPQLEVFSGTTRIATNNDWLASVSYLDAFAATGAFPLTVGSRDAAIIFYLTPGSYTAQLSGVGGTTGEGLIEIYELPP
jgi:uncharacterized delta-60 repeat protein